MKERIIYLNKKLKATDKVLSFNKIFTNKQLIEKHHKHAYIVLGIDNESKIVYYSFYTEKEKETALLLYSNLEDKENYNGLFVEIDDIKNLQKAYPNYLIDNTLFVGKFNDYATSNYWVNPKSNISL